MNSERKIIAYKIIKSGEGCSDLDYFSEKCHACVVEGFQPFHPPLIKPPPGSLFIQAFVKYEEPKVIRYGATETKVGEEDISTFPKSEEPK